MGFKLFDQVDLGNEAMSPIVAEPMDIETVIATQEAFAGIADVEKEYENANATIALANTVTGNLEAQIAHESAILAKPESITGATVVLSQESLIATAKLLGAEGTLAGLSIESIAANPVTSLELSIEEKQSLIARVIETVKVLAKKFVAMLKKLYTKAVVAMSGVSKQAGDLSKEIAGVKDGADVKVEDGGKLAQLINAKFGAAMFVLESKDPGSNLIAGIFAKLEGLNKTADIASGTATLIAGIDKAISDLGEKVAGKDLAKTVAELAIADGQVVRFDGASVKTIKTSKPTIDEGKEYSKKEAINAIAQITFSVTSEKAPLVKGIAEIKFANLATMAVETGKAADTLKSFSDSVNKAIEGAVKNVKGLKEGDDDKKYLPATKMANVMISNVGMDLILGYLGAVKGSLSVTNAVFKLSKGEKPAEGDKK